MQENMKDFVTSSPAAGALFTIIMGDLSDFSVVAFRDKLEKYADGCGDGGLTRATMRSACGLPAEEAAPPAPDSSAGPSHVPRHAPVCAVRVAAHGVESVESRRIPHGLQSEQEVLLRCHVSLLSHCLHDGHDLCSEYFVSRLPLEVWPLVNKRDRVGVLRQLKARGLWKELPARGRSGVLLIPHISTGSGIRALFTTAGHPDPPNTFPEALQSDHSMQWCENMCLISHLTKLHQACDSKANEKHRGGLNASAVAVRKVWASKARKYRSHLTWMTEVRRRVSETESDNMADMVLSQGGT